MEGIYPVYYGTDQVGKVTVQRCGLYYRFHCRCKKLCSSVCRLRVCSGEIKENLGVLVPFEDGFVLDTKIPVKRLGDKKPEFLIVPKHDRPAGEYVPVYPEEPFAYISRLKEAYLVRQNGQIGLMLKTGVR